MVVVSIVDMVVDNHTMIPHSWICHLQPFEVDVDNINLLFPSQSHAWDCVVWTCEIVVEFTVPCLGPKPKDEKRVIFF